MKTVQASATISDLKKLKRNIFWAEKLIYPCLDRICQEKSNL